MYHYSQLVAILLFLPYCIPFSTDITLLQKKGLGFNNRLLKSLIHPKRATYEVLLELTKSEDEDLAQLSIGTVKTVIAALASVSDGDLLVKMISRFYKINKLSPAMLYTATHYVKQSSDFSSQKRLLELAAKFNYPVESEYVNSVFDWLLENEDVNGALNFMTLFEETLKLSSAQLDSKRNLIKSLSRLPNKAQLVNMMKSLSKQTNSSWSVPQEAYIRGIETALHSDQLDTALDVLEGLSTNDSTSTGVDGDAVQRETFPLLLSTFLSVTRQHSNTHTHAHTHTHTHTHSHTGIEVRARRYIDQQLLLILRRFEDLNEPQLADLLLRYLLSATAGAARSRLTPLVVDVVVEYLRRAGACQLQLSTLALMGVNTLLGHPHHSHSSILLATQLDIYLRTVNLYVFKAARQCSLAKESVLLRSYEENLSLVQQLIKGLASPSPPPSAAEALSSSEENIIDIDNDNQASDDDDNNDDDGDEAEVVEHAEKMLSMFAKDLQRSNHITDSSNTNTTNTSRDMSEGIIMVLQQSLEHRDFSHAADIIQLLLRKDMKKSLETSHAMQTLFLQLVQHKNHSHDYDHDLPLTLDLLYKISSESLSSQLQRQPPTNSQLLSSTTATTRSFLSSAMPSIVIAPAGHQRFERMYLYSLLLRYFSRHVSSTPRHLSRSQSVLDLCDTPTPATPAATTAEEASMAWTLMRCLDSVLIALNVNNDDYRDSSGQSVHSERFTALHTLLHSKDTSISHREYVAAAMLSAYRILLTAADEDNAWYEDLLAIVEQRGLTNDESLHSLLTAVYTKYLAGILPTDHASNSDDNDNDLHVKAVRVCESLLRSMSASPPSMTSQQSITRLRTCEQFLQTLEGSGSSEAQSRLSLLLIDLKQRITVPISITESRPQLDCSSKNKSEDNVFEHIRDVLTLQPVELAHLTKRVIQMSFDI